MTLLSLQRPTEESGDADAVKDRFSLLQKVESIVWSVINSSGRFEARLWLCNTISLIHSVNPDDQRELFVDLLESKFSRRDVAVQVLQMIFNKWPEKAGLIIAKKCHMLEKFFEGNPRRIMQWFDNFAAISEARHKKGARAISQFAFLNRDICWDELEWKGRHGQSPAVVATKPHYFHDLDVLRTVENFLEYVPDFWTSDELAESVKGGEILQIDEKYFADQFMQLMYEDRCEDVWAVIEEFLMEERFSSLCLHLLILLNDDGLCTFLKCLRKFIRPNLQCKEFKFSCCWIEILLSCDNFASLDELLLLNSMITKSRQLLRFIGDEEHEEEKCNLEELLRNTTNFSDPDHWALLKECVEMKRPEAIKWVAIQSWVLFYNLSKECKTPQSCESLLIRNGIYFRKADDYLLIQAEELTRRSHKKRKRGKKRRKKYDEEEGFPDDLEDFENSNGWSGLELGRRSWFLSTDDFSSAWNIADIPEHLCTLCFREWSKWVYSK